MVTEDTLSIFNRWKIDDLVLRVMMFAVYYHKPLRVFRFASCVVKPFQVVSGGRIFIKSTCIDYIDGRRVGRCTVYDADGVITLKAEVDRVPGQGSIAIKQYIPGPWEDAIPVPPGWMVVETDLRTWARLRITE